LALWTPADGLAWHTLWIGNAGELTGWVAHSRPEQGDPLSSGMKEAGQVYVTGLEAPFHDGAVQHEEVSEGAAGPLLIRSVHQLTVRRGKGTVAPVAPAVAPVIAPPAGPSSTFGWSVHIEPDPAAGPCEVTAVCRCTVRGSFVGVVVPQPQLPVGSRAYAGAWTVLSSTCPDTEPSARIGWESPVALFVTPEPGGAVAVTASSEPRDPKGEVPSFWVTGRPSAAGGLASSSTESRGAVGADGAFRLVRVEVRRTIDLGKELGP
jgi:hypothetical protein